MKICKRVLSVTSIVAVLFGTSLLAQEQTPKQILDNAFQYIHSMDKYAFKAVVIDQEKSEDGTVKKYRFDTSVIVNKPGKLQVNVKGPSKDRSNYLYNGVYTMMDHTFNYYGQIKADKTIGI